MAKKAAAGRSPVKKSASKSRSPAKPTHESLLAELHKLDAEIVRLANRRTSVALELAELVDEEVDSRKLPSDDAILAAAIEANEGPLATENIRAVLRELIGGARTLHRPVRVAFLGPEYSYSHLATLRRFGHKVQLVSVLSIGAVFESVNRGDVDYGLVPLENSTDGRIVDTLDMFTRLPLRICGEVQMRIHHYLLAKCPPGEVTQIYSKPQALSQCRDWLARHMPAARPVPITSTAAAAELARDRPNTAAIASREAGIHYGLNVLASKIEDHQGNLTRFAVIGGEAAPPSGEDKTALMFQVPNQSGALADAIQIFKKNELNLTWIESFPAPHLIERYLFFVECEGHESDDAVQKAVAALEKKALRLEVLGSYPVSDLDIEDETDGEG